MLKRVNVDTTVQEKRVRFPTDARLYAHARQMKREKKCTRKLQTYLGRVIRDIERKCPEPDRKLDQFLDTSIRIFKQQHHDKNKVYSIHAPEVECISKGKAHKR